MQVSDLVRAFVPTRGHCLLAWIGGSKAFAAGRAAALHSRHECAHPHGKFGLTCGRQPIETLWGLRP